MEYTACGFPIIGDDFRVDATLDGFGFGYEGRDLLSYPLAGLKCASMSALQPFDEAELLERIAEKNANKSWVTHKADAAGSKVKNQSRSSYCWGHSVVRGMEYCDLLMGGMTDPLSAFYLCANIKNGRNQGGSGIVAVEWASKHGTCTEAMHPPMDFRVDRNPEHVANAELHQIVSFEEFDPRDMMRIYTSVVLDQPVTVGIPAWGHEVLLTFLVVENGKIYPGFDNSWSEDWGNNGRGVLKGNKTRFDEAMSIISVEPAKE